MDKESSELEPDEFAEEMKHLEEMELEREKLNYTTARFRSFIENTEKLGPIEEALISALAAYKRWADLLAELAPGDTTIQQDLRKQAERAVRDVTLFAPPWSTLIKMEFSGEDLTQAELEVEDPFNEEWEEFRAKVFAAIPKFKAFLEDRDVIVTEDDEVFLVSLISIKAISEVRRTSFREEVLIKLHETGRTDQGWFDLVHAEFPN